MDLQFRWHRLRNMLLDIINKQPPSNRLKKRRNALYTKLTNKGSCEQNRDKEDAKNTTGGMKETDERT